MLGNATLAERFNELSQQEQDERKTYANINGAIDTVSYTHLTLPTILLV